MIEKVGRLKSLSITHKNGLRGLRGLRRLRGLRGFRRLSRSEG